MDLEHAYSVRNQKISEVQVREVPAAVSSKAAAHLFDDRKTARYFRQSPIPGD